MTLSDNLSIDGVVPVVEDTPETQVQHDISCANVAMQDAPLVVCHLDDYSPSISCIRRTMSQLRTDQNITNRF